MDPSIEGSRYEVVSATTPADTNAQSVMTNPICMPRPFTAASKANVNIATMPQDRTNMAALNSTTELYLARLNLRDCCR